MGEVEAILIRPGWLSLGGDGGCIDPVEVMSRESLGSIGEDWATGLSLSSDE